MQDLRESQERPGDEQERIQQLLQLARMDFLAAAPWLLEVAARERREARKADRVASETRDLED